MDTFPGHFTIGFTGNSTFENNAKVIDSSYQDLQTSIGAVESSCGDEVYWSHVFLPAILKP
jgi:hypothetical protein